jgi:DNA-binding MarR family transcriptional regulator
VNQLAILNTVKQKDHYRHILRLVNGIGRLTNPQHLPALRDRGTSLARFLTLDGLCSADRPLRMSELAEVSGLAATELSRLVSGLDEEGFVKRARDPEDNRARLVSLTRRGARLAGQVHREATADLRDVWTDFTHDEWHRFIDYLTRFEAGLRRVRANPNLAASKSRQK